MTRWTAENVETLQRLLAKGCSAREVATALGGGVTRNAVIGKANRMKAAARPRGRPRLTPLARMSKAYLIMDRVYKSSYEPWTDELFAAMRALEEAMSACRNHDPAEHQENLRNGAAELATDQREGR
jgi:hypothetical protein